MNRRNFLGSVVAIGGTALAGCLGETAATKLTQAPTDAIKVSTREETATKSVYDVSGRLKSGEFEGMSFFGKLGFTLKWDLEVKGSAIDVWVMDQKEQEPFMNKGEVMYSQGVSKFGVKSGKASGGMAPGKYVIIFENSGAYETAPKGAVDIDATVQLLFE